MDLVKIKFNNQDSIVVWIHGVLSNSEACWKNKNGTYWPRMFVEELNFQQFDCATFSYYTSITSGKFTISEIAENLRESLRSLNVKYRNVIFICHSMGGIVCRRYIVDNQRKLKNDGIRIGLFLIASPSLGSKYANILSPFAWVMRHSQAKILKKIEQNEPLLSLNTAFLNLKDSGEFEIHGKEIVESDFIFFKGLIKTNIVGKHAGRVFFANPVTIPNSTHTSIAKPADKKAPQHTVLLNFMSDFVSNEKEPFIKKNFIQSKELMYYLNNSDLLSFLKELGYIFTNREDNFTTNLISSLRGSLLGLRHKMRDNREELLNTFSGIIDDISKLNMSIEFDNFTVDPDKLYDLIKKYKNEIDLKF